MDSAMIHTYRKRLEAERRKILAEVEINERPADFGDDVDHFDEETDEAEETSTRLSIVEALKNRLNEIEAALNDIEANRYGICKACSKEIGAEVLSIAPESQFCSNCKKKQNRRRRD